MTEYSSLPAWQVMIGAAVLIPLLYVLGLCVRCLYFHPLSRFPGPKLWAISRLPYLYHHMTGTLAFAMLDFHERYGDIVRVAPDELAFSHPDAWQDIMGHARGGGNSSEFEKSAWFTSPLDGEPYHIISAPREQHGRLRRQMAHGFSDKAMREQEPLIKRYVDVLLRKLGERCGDGENALVISDWFNFTTFDIIGDLAFGEPFGCLESSHYHAWVRSVLEYTRYATVLQALKFWPPLRKFLFSLVPGRITKHRETHRRLTREKMQRRIAMHQDRPDLIEGLLKLREELELGIDELVANAQILIVAGSETTGTLLSGVTYYLLSNPECLQKATDEVRKTFKSEDEIDLISVGHLPYMLACLNEALRIYPPIARGLPRVVPKGGAKILGHFIPEKTDVCIHQWALYHQPKYWVDPFGFHPERFLGDPRFATDRKETLQPFHIGPRNCLGRNLAYSEMRLILARILYRFDLRLAEESVGWEKQRCYILWQKGQLKVYLKPAQVKEATRV